MRTTAAFIAAVVFWGGVSEVTAQEANRRTLRSKFSQDLTKIVREHPGVVGLAIRDVTSGRFFGVNEDYVFPQGSAIKIPILLALFIQAEEGEVDLARAVQIRREALVGGSGLLQYFRDSGSSLTLHDLGVMMMTVSDNSATNILIDELGITTIDSLVQGLGYQQTRLRRVMMDTKARAVGDENISTPANAAEMMSDIVQCDLPLSRELCERMKAILEAPHPHGSPIREESNTADSVGEKGGWIPGVRSAWAYVVMPGRRYAISIQGNYSTTDGVEKVIRAVAARANLYFSSLSGATEYGTRVPVDLLRN